MAQAPDTKCDEIEITPAMMEAGAYAWATGDNEFDSIEIIVSRIFREMMKSKKQECKA
jgi:hypothetical protein